ncbi:undecaprenyl-phosphate glucose phosphotransferase [Variovorax sp. OV329]|uniref:undecaprenyl-phosphate glucose phosphotransferase n=1 Tax=Variovorax sp. OV329 TaxID=1882825 RepID=UPI0008E9712F|nr:undecaprenyl-phosphate glucose phosphotransferase [Variovorax sp. OV329]SFN41409.1 putative colanic acid biosysnthesis UDP-glucose lipid carrier transferase [Variovorax sp. OV329]
MLSGPATGVRESSLPAAGRLNLLLDLILRIGDVAIFVVAGVLAYLVRFGHAQLEPDYLHGISRGVLFALIILNSSSLYRLWRGRTIAAELLKLSTLFTLLFCSMAVYALAMRDGHDTSRLWWANWLVFSLGGSVLLRMAVRARRGLARQMDKLNSVVVGANPEAQRLVDAIQQDPNCGIEVNGWFATHADRAELTGAPMLGRLDNLDGYVESRNVDLVWLALPMREQGKISYALNQLRYSTADIKLVPDMFGLHLLNQSVETVAGLPVITLQQSPLHGASRLVKAAEDRLLSLLILTMISPLMLAIAGAVKLSSPGPVFYRQERVSWNGRRFYMLKFRSMPVDAEQGTGAVWAKAGENRATRVGAFLRKTSLDELPQFFNVLWGDMSIVGPRPERPVFVEQFKHEIPDYMKKHMVKAGITGWAQVNGWRGSTDLAKRIECDMYYVENWSLKFDLQIIALTVFKGFSDKNAY